MKVEISLALFGLAAVVIGVLSQAPKLGEDRWRAVNAWGYAAIGIGLLVACFSVVKSWNDEEKDREQRREISELKEIVSQVPIRPEDFVIRVLADYHFEPDGMFPDAVSIEGTLGKASYLGELVKTNTETTIRGGGRGAGYVGHRYRTAGLNFPTGLSQYPNVKSIDGQSFTAHFLTNKFPSPPESNVYREFFVDLYLSSYHCTMNRISDGQYQTVIGLENCK